MCVHTGLVYVCAVSLSVAVCCGLAVDSLLRCVAHVDNLLRCVADVEGLLRCVADLPSGQGVPPLTPGTTQKMSQVLQESFRSFEKEQQRLNIPKGKQASPNFPPPPLP